MKKFWVITFLGLICFFNLIAQKEATIWYFGEHAGLDFNSGIPIALTDGKIPGGYGSAVASDEEGNLLFYTNGETIWNKNHDTLSNGIGLSGKAGASQSAMIVKDFNANLYYVFTTDFTTNTTNGFQYSIVNMNLDGGLGEITQKNSPLFYPSTEKINAAFHSNNMDIWVLAHQRDTDAFYAYLISNTGLNSSPVISHAGGVKSGFAAGHMKLSPSSTQLAITLKDTIGIFNFDNATGIVSELLMIDTKGITNGVEYSPDGSKLYFTSCQNLSSNPINKVYQVDLLAGSNEQIKNSVQLIYTDTSTNAAPSLPQLILALELGPDGKIYSLSSNNNYLDVINTPNLNGSNCGYTDSVLFLGGMITSYGLPNFAPIYTAKKITAVNTCSNDTTHFLITHTNDIGSVLWNFNDPNSTSNSSTEQTPFHIYSAIGSYEVSVTITYLNNISKTVHSTIIIEESPVFHLGNDTSICKGSVLPLHPSAPAYSYRWSNGSSTTDITVQTAGSYWVEASLGNCKRTDTLNISYYPVPTLLPEGDLQLCYKDTLRLSVSEDSITYRWNDGSADSFFNVTTSGTYYVDVTNICGTSRLSKTVKNISCCTPEIPNLLTANNDGKNETLFISCIEDGGWQLAVFNRWGDRVFQSSDYQNDLDGIQFEDGVYYYALSKPGKDSYKGWFHILK